METKMVELAVFDNDEICKECFRTSYRKIFKNADTEGDCFQKSEYLKKVLYQTADFKLTRRQYYALKNTLKAMNLPMKVFEIVTEYNKEVSETHNQIILHDFQNGSYEKYLKRSNGLWENQLFSESMSWGIGISQEYHAILGCTEEFYNVFQSFYRKEDKRRFVKAWEGEKNDNPHIDLQWFEAIKAKLV